MATTPNTLSPSEYWMSPDALTIELNALDNPQYLQVSLLAGSVITAFHQDVIDYDASLNFRKWTLQAYNNYFDRTDRAYVYAQLDKKGNSALIIYSYDMLELTETITDSSGETRDVYNVFLATISPSVNSDGENVFRTWEKELDTGGLSTDKITYEWKGYFEKRTDSYGNSYLYTKLNIVSQLGITAYGSNGFEVPSIFDGLPLDNVTIWKNPDTGLIEVIGGTGGGSDFDATKMWAALSAATNEQINKSHLTTALNGYATESWVKDRGYALQTSLDAVSTKLNNFLEGSDTDTIINKWKELEAFLSGMAETDNLAEILSNKADTSYVDTELTKYVTLAKEETIDGLKHFTNGLTIGATKHKIYEKDGNILIEGNVLVTGGITAYSDGSSSGGSGGGGIDVEVLWEILGGTGTQQINITHLTDALTWNNISSKPSWIGSTKPSYDWSEIGSKPTTIGGYGITDGVNAVTTTGTGNAVTSASISGHTLTLTKGSTFSLHGHTHTYLPYQDTRNENYNPYDNNFNEKGLSATHLKRNTIDGLNDGGTYHTSIYLYPWDDTSGGAVHNLAFTDNGNMWLRSGVNSWNSWKKLAFTTDNVASATNAAMLNGLNWDNFFSRRYYTFDLNSYSTSNFYPLFFTDSDIELDCEIHSNNTYGSDAYNQNRIHFQLTTQGWNDTGMSFHLLSQNNYDDNEITIGAIGRGQHKGGIAIWVRGGRTYRVYSNREPVFKSSNYTYEDEVYSVGTNLWGGTNTNVDIIWKNDSTRKEKMITTNDGNIASATKLQTARTIWGQSFDGTEDVNGTLSGAPAIELYYSTPFIDFHYGYSTDDYTNRIIEIESGKLQFTHNVVIAGNVGIGTSSPSYKLDVSGDIHANGWLRTTGNVGWYSQTHDGGWYMEDSSWIRAYNSKSVYTAGIIQAGSGFESSSSSILRYTHYTNRNIITWSYDNTYGDCITFNIPGNNSGSNYAKLSSARGLDLWGTFTANGNILATGGITCYASDQRAKTVIEQISLSLKQIANAPTIRFKWNNWKIKDDGKTHIGGIAQYMQKLLPETVLEADDMLNMDYATTGYIFAVQTAKHLVKTDTEVERLKKRVKKLEKQLKQLGYEEANIMDD